MQDLTQLWTDVHLVTLANDDQAFGLIRNGAIAAKSGRIIWIGKQSDVPEYKHAQVFSCNGRFLTPGFIDCHTHLVYAGNRAAEFEMRLGGSTYEEIARRGGGILSTVRQTREATQEELTTSATARLCQFVREGVTTIEIKSGYGLDTINETKILLAVRDLQSRVPVRIESTFLGAHALPPEFEERPDDYIDVVCQEMLPAIARDRLATAVDAFCETIAFSGPQIRRVFEVARTYDIKVKLHADQLSDSGGAELAASFNALSADHLEYASESGVRAMANSRTVAVLLPGAYYTLGGKRAPPVELFRNYNVPIAIASDSNPGSAPVLSLRLMLNMACTLFGLTPEEALIGVTRAAATALGLQKEIGTLEVGKRADFAIWDIDHPSELAYYAGGNLCFKSFTAGEEISLSIDSSG